MQRTLQPNVAASCSALKWAAPAEKARLVKARGKEYGQTLVRVDSRPGVRRRGKYPEAEKEVFEKFTP